MAQAVKIGNRLFGALKAADNHYKNILDSVAIGQPIFDPTHHKDLVALLLRYDAVLIKHGVASKVPARISHFEKRWNRQIGWSTNGFWVFCINGFGTDFSYKKAIRAKIDPPDFNFYKACRHAVAEDLLEAKKDAFHRHSNSDGTVKCEVTRKWVSYEDAHLDHAGPFYFRVLVSMFRESNGWTDHFPEHLLTASGPGDFVVRFIDRQIREAFRTLHSRHSDLRLVSKEANLGTAHLARRPKIQCPVVIR